MTLKAFRVRCPACGEVDVDVDDVRLSVCTDEPKLSSYGFTCPGCREVHVEKASSYVVGLLSGNVPTHRFTRPAELDEPHDLAPPLTYDDLLDLCLDLKQAKTTEDDAA